MRIAPERAEVLGAAFLKALAPTVRWYYVGWEEVAEEAFARGLIVAFWHNRILGACILPLFRNFQTTTLVSNHRDGEIITRLAARFGHDTVRGSTGKDGLKALLSLARRAGPKRLLGITPDGPQGPRYTVQPGAAILAARTGLAVVPFVPAYRFRWKAKSWDRFEVPYPGTRALAFFGPPVRVARDADLVAARAEVEAACRKATCDAEAFFGRVPEPPGDTTAWDEAA